MLFQLWKQSRRIVVEIKPNRWALAPAARLEGSLWKREMGILEPPRGGREGGRRRGGSPGTTDVLHVSYVSSAVVLTKPLVLSLSLSLSLSLFLFLPQCTDRFGSYRIARPCFYRGSWGRRGRMVETFFFSICCPPPPIPFNVSSMTHLHFKMI